MPTSFVPLWHRRRTSSSAGSEADRPAGGHPRPQVPHRRHLDRRLHGARSGGERASGGEIVAAWTRGLLDAAEFNNVRLTACSASRTSEDLHAAELPTRTPNSSSIMFNKTKKFDALRREDARHHRECGRGLLLRHVLEGGRPLFEGLSGLQPADKVRFFKTPDAILKKQIEVYDEVVKKKSAENALFGDPRVADRLRPSRHAVGAGYGGQPPYGLRPLLCQNGTLKRPDPPGPINRLLPRPSPDFTIGRCALRHCESAADEVQLFLDRVDRFNTWVGKAAAWLIVALMLLVCARCSSVPAERADRLDLRRSNMLYGTLFMLCGPMPLPKNGCAR